ncbi:MULTISPECIES: hypothetical protein [unclassified Paenibacillus]|uniref:Uncharacterized protein n=1 Tax=Paenibacillus provencensis TaxID=441151 RepID=A0ABW3Q3D0_9BACL|nr:MULTISPECIES: hypothetical protein [unclassified Paenibacillus]MCM3130177.1 hypothetical protein [Paenibacillus sp. MER 78]SDX71141.1 hypothetical protein SAMN05518848_11269 [Paenibacillus sp. PDC88]SFS88510.1 hypothetical protein SAMN04488601_10665 [Paenibacillus sp. 453mf]
MLSEGGLRKHEDIIRDILGECTCRNCCNGDHEKESHKLSDAKKILTNQGLLINRLKSIEAEIKAPQS